MPNLRGSSSSIPTGFSSNLILVLNAGGFSKPVLPGPPNMLFFNLPNDFTIDIISLINIIITIYMI